MKRWVEIMPLKVTSLATQPKSLHVAILAYCLEGGGIQRQTLTLAGEMAARGHRVDYVVVRAVGELVGEVPPGVNLVGLVASKGSSQSCQGFKALYQMLALPRLAAYLRTSRPDALLSGGTHANVIAILGHILARAGNRLVLRITSHMSRSQGKAGLLPRLSPMVARLLYPVADEVVAVSHDVRDDFLRTSGFDPAHAQMIREPVITAVIREKAAEDPAHPWFEGGAPPVILAVGRLSPEKDFETLIRAFAEIRRKRDLRLVILGPEINQGYGGKLRKLVAALGVKDSVDLAGYSRNPYALMARARVFALSSLHEGCPNVLAEALYCGAPVVATDCPGGVREVLRNGILGALVPVQNPAALAEALEAALDKTLPPRLFLCPEGFDAASSVTRYLALLSGEGIMATGLPVTEGAGDEIEATA